MHLHGAFFIILFLPHTYPILNLCLTYTYPMLLFPSLLRYHPVTTTEG
jgi:hypothetical protein